ncbi:hypothetical protein PGTUg99_027077 [Puccinia graminis f. sp. tritici]|uniref:Uncharacterized protein n=1 Tax=Puccinia graminis f. sp. tritici TaxID=56615 RepID=A0A5B0Q945_PUCGR|nr:hypothetical protein PGTUg99_027077 [Puccinia graminis f. sp. tritici]
MRFTLVAGALVLSASISEARSIAPSPSKNPRTTSVRLEALNVRIGTPLRISKRASVQGGEWNTSATQQDTLPKVDAADSTSTTPAAHHDPPAEAHEPPKRSHPKPTSDGSRVHEYSQHESRRRRRSPSGVFRTTIPSVPAAVREPLASTVDGNLPQASPLLENMQFTIKPVDAATKLSNQPEEAPASPIYTITPITSGITTTIAQKVKPSSAAINTVDRVKASGEPTTALLQAIEHYREDVTQESPAGADTLNHLPIPQVDRTVESFAHGVSRTSANLSPLQDNTAAIGPLGSTSISDTDAAGLSNQ